MKDYYEILDIDPNASDQEVKDAFRRLAKRYHPDTNPGQRDSSQFIDAREAYSVLSDPVMRENYNLWLLENSDRYVEWEEGEEAATEWEAEADDFVEMEPQATATVYPEHGPREADLGPEWTPFLWMLWIILPVLFGGVASLLSSDPLVWLGAAGFSLILALWMTAEIRSRH